MEMEKSVSLVKLSFSKKGLLKGTIIIVCLIALIAAIMIMPVAATTTTISPDKGAYIRDYSSYVNKNYGDTTPLWVYGRDGKNRRALIHFDLSSIPSGATIGSATLYLYNIYTPQEDRTLNVHRITDSWAEGSGNNELNSATINGTTWNERWFGANWGTAGGDYDSTVTGSNTSGTMADVWLEWDVKTDVQGFVSETYSNHGWLVKFEPEGSPTVCVKFPSREYTDDSTKRPKLVVEYTEAPCGCVGATQTFTCGETVTESCVFNCDMSCPAGRGLKMGANDIIVDGAGFTLDGVTPGDACTASGAARTGIYNSPFGDEEEHNNIVIKNLTIKNFCNGIYLNGDEDYHVVNNTIENCRVYNNGRNVAGVKSNGIKLIFVYESTIENCKIYNNTGGEGCTPPCENGGSGIFMYAGNDNIITNNDIYDNKKGGFFTKAKPMRNEISHNEVWGNHQGGIIVRCKCSQNLTIEYNNASCNYGTGIFIGGPCNTIRHNNVSNNKNGSIEPLPDTGHGGCGVNFGRDDADVPCGPGGSCGSRLNSLINNTICDNEYLDIWERAAVRGTNNGVENKCDEPDGWNDDGGTGCTYPCTAPIVTSLTITPNTGITSEVQAYNVTVNTTGFTSLNVTIPARFRAKTPSGGEEIARADLWWNNESEPYYGYVTFTANATDKMDVCAYIGEISATYLGMAVSYTEGATTSIKSPFGSHPERANLTLPTESANGSLKISGLPETITNVTVSIGAFVQNPDSANTYTFTAKAEGETEGKSAMVTISAPAPPCIVSYAPVSAAISDTESATRTFNVTVNQTVNVSWLVNGTQVQYNNTGGVTEASYTNTSAILGTWNVSAVASNTNGTDMQTWIWTVEEPSPCFIATAAYGTALHEDIDVLRDFRDEYLMTNPLGRTLVKTYYETSPPIADALREHEGLRTAVRETLIKPLVYISRMFVEEEKQT